MESRSENLFDRLCTEMFGLLNFASTSIFSPRHICWFLTGVLLFRGTTAIGSSFFFFMASLTSSPSLLKEKFCGTWSCLRSFCQTSWGTSWTSCFGWFRTTVSDWRFTSGTPVFRSLLLFTRSSWRLFFHSGLCFLFCSLKWKRERYFFSFKPNSPFSDVMRGYSRTHHRASILWSCYKWRVLCALWSKPVIYIYL